ncbi:MAG: peptidoglycan-binding protein [Oscillospiraceae bacterium]|nr:peptidoglycan-binding protein [Oscillospiraceae bacterium]
MGIGYLTIQTRTDNDTLPIKAHVTITQPDGTVLYETDTDSESGSSETFELTAPDKELTLDETYNAPAYSVVDVHVYADGYRSVSIHNVEIVDTRTAMLPVTMVPIEDPDGTPDIDLNIDPVTLLDPTAHTLTNITLVPVALLDPTPRNHVAPPDPPARTGVMREVFIPDFITVHLGRPDNPSARNVRVRFVDYIKNVTSSEIYPTWPHNALVANIHAIVSFTLNRIYTEWYRIRGNNFDITNSTAFDQAFRYGGPIFDNISQIVDGIFNTYARRIGFQNPFFTSYCNGTTATCAGLSQWGTVPLANQGLSPLQILHRFYPRDLELVSSDNIRGITESFPGTPLRLGSSGPAVQRMQNFLNRIRINFPLIPRISNPNGVFDAETQEAVRVFQRTFNLNADGVIGRETWNRISFTNVAVTRLAELDSEGTRVTIGENPPNVVLSQGARGENVLQLQFLLNFISEFYDPVPTVIKDSVFGADTRNAVIEFQRLFNLTPDGVVGPNTWNRLYAVYRGINETTPIPPNPVPPPDTTPPFPGTLIRVGSTGENVRLIQSRLNSIGQAYPSIQPHLAVDGVFGPLTQAAVIAFQREFVLTPDGIVGPITWGKMMEIYALLEGGTGTPQPPVTPPVPPPATLPPYPGTLIRLGSTGENVRLIQSALNTIRAENPSIPQLAVDGIFGSITQSAVIAFQRAFGLVPDGLVGPITWGRLQEALPTIGGGAAAPSNPPFPGTLIRMGSTGENVRLIQSTLNAIRAENPSIPQLAVDGIFGPMTQSAVVTFQRIFNLVPDGIVGPLTWGALIAQRNALL